MGFLPCIDRIRASMRVSVRSLKTISRRFWRGTTYPRPILGSFIIEEVEDKKTKVILKMLFKSAGEWDKLREFVPEKNGENCARLEGVSREMNDKAYRNWSKHKILK